MKIFALITDRVLLSRLLVWSVVLLMPGFSLWAASEEIDLPEEKKRISVYDVANVEVSMPLGGKSVEVVQSAGMTAALKEALQRLLMRMLTRADQEAHKPFLATLFKEPKQLTERVVVRAQKQIDDHLNLTVDVMFAKKAINEALNAENITHSETAFPLVLLLSKNESLSGATQSSSDLLQNALLKIARDYGITLLLPMGDLEDLKHLSWDETIRGEAAVLNWATERYGATNIWAVTASFSSSSAKQSAAKFQASGVLVVSRSQGEPLVYKGGMGKSGASHEEVADFLYSALATQLIQQSIDGWILEHALHPALTHQTRLRVIHNAQLVRLTKFLKDLRAVPGVKHLRVVNTLARETVYEFDYQGRDEVLLELLTGLGKHVEHTPELTALWLIAPPSEMTTPTPSMESPVDRSQEPASQFPPTRSSSDGWM